VKNSRWRWYWPDWTTATQCCTVLQPAAFRFCSEWKHAARVVLQAPRRSHAQPLLRELHWLPIQHRIEYKVAVLNFKSRSSATAPTCLILSSSHQGSCQWTDTSLVWGPTTRQAVHQDRLRETSFSLFCANCLELVAWDNNQRWLAFCL